MHSRTSYNIYLSIC